MRFTYCLILSSLAFSIKAESLSKKSYVEHKTYSQNLKKLKPSKDGISKNNMAQEQILNKIHQNKNPSKHPLPDINESEINRYPNPIENSYIQSIKINTLTYSEQCDKNDNNIDNKNTLQTPVDNPLEVNQLPDLNEKKPNLKRKDSQKSNTRQISVLSILFYFMKILFFENHNQTEERRNSIFDGSAYSNLGINSYFGGSGLSKFTFTRKVSKEKNKSIKDEEISKLGEEILAKTNYSLTETQFETTSWLTVFIAQFYTKVRMELEKNDTLLNSISDALNSELKPSIIDNIIITQFSLGTDFPRILSARMSPSSNSFGMMAELQLEFIDGLSLGFDTRVVAKFLQETIASLPVSMVLSITKFIGTRIPLKGIFSQEPIKDDSLPNITKEAPPNKPADPVDTNKKSLYENKASFHVNSDQKSNSSYNPSNYSTTDSNDNLRHRFPSGRMNSSTIQKILNINTNDLDPGYSQSNISPTNGNFGQFEIPDWYNTQVPPRNSINMENNLNGGSFSGGNSSTSRNIRKIDNSEIFNSANTNSKYFSMLNQLRRQQSKNSYFSEPQFTNSGLKSLNKNHDNVIYASTPSKSSKKYQPDSNQNTYFE
ncbi:Maintenance of mitochondrial morphology protein 1 [Smittium culicis]|uniref:Maintenance of mitochondrial morphology protein 1 n=1 Tax=Smittium culicis TaxID=133412 RepID=A0A1R1XZL7_9FUNG|nr:Maintenance of mitochondrial morphology protein 1 [Smittium culicis]